ncbi:MAG: beta-N-acetylhexosaminidase [Desulfobacteraceae bacterium]|nr:MAG: beta-N-acetylhexosaminidase [Desulfobacteraceae bacterium]
MTFHDFSDRQIAGQRLMVGFEGKELNSDLKYIIRELKIGGLILFAINLSSPEQIRELCVSAQDYALSCNQPPLFIAIDQEGGQVARLKKPFTCFPGNPSMKNEVDAVDFARITASELKSIGINMNMAPVMDVPLEGIQSVMTERAFGCDPKWVATMGQTVIQTLQDNGIMAVAKHYPGIGRTTLDSHIDAPFLDASISDMEETDLLPFRAAIDRNVAGIMLSHIRYVQFDQDLPASLSRRIAKDLLRDQMGYQGLVLTDDLDMGSIRNYFDIKDSIRYIFDAEIDIALICHKGPDIESAFTEMLTLTGHSSNRKNQAYQSLDRIFQLKKQYRLPYPLLT